MNDVLLEKVPTNYITRRRILFPGFADKLAYGLGLIDTDLPFEEARRRFRIDEKARESAGRPDFSARIRGRR